MYQAACDQVAVPSFPQEVQGDACKTDHQSLKVRMTMTHKPFPHCLKRVHFEELPNEMQSHKKQVKIRNLA